MSKDRKAKREASFWLAALALFIRALLPGGYMVAPGAAHATPEIRLCDPGTVATAPAPGGHGAEHGDAPHHGKHHCPFAVDSGTAAPPHAAALPVRTIPQTTLRAEPRAETAALPSLAAPPPPATGPPLS